MKFFLFLNLMSLKFSSNTVIHNFQEDSIKLSNPKEDDLINAFNLENNLMLS